MKTLTTKEAAAFLGISEWTLHTWRSTRRVEIPYLKIGRVVRYRLEDLETFKERSLVSWGSADE